MWVSWNSAQRHSHFTEGRKWIFALRFAFLVNSVKLGTADFRLRSLSSCEFHAGLFSERRTLSKGASKWNCVHTYHFFVRSGQNSALQLSAIIYWAILCFVKIDAGKAIIVLTGVNEIKLRVYRGTVWDLESKDCLCSFCVLRSECAIHSLVHIIFRRISKFKYLILQDWV